MGRALIGTCFTLLLGGQLSAQSGVNLQAKPIRDSLLVSVLNSGELQNLDSVGPDEDPQLAIRLYRMAREGSCVEETHWVCSYRYIMAVSEYDELPNRAVFDLGEVGEIRNIRWLASTRPDQALWEVEVQNYPAHAVKQNPKLVVRMKRYRLDITVQRVAVTSID